MKRRNESGFTLAELLIVVAIIAVLVAIAIPVFTSQLEKSREAVDMANVRAAYAEVMTAAISEDGNAKYEGAAIRQNDGTYKAVVTPLTQRIDGWTTNVSSIEIGGVPSKDWIGFPAAGGSCTVTYDPDTGGTTINWTGSSGGSPGTGGGGIPESANATGEACMTALSSLMIMAPNNTSVAITVENGTVTNLSVNNGSGGGNHESFSQEQAWAALESEGVIDADHKLINGSGESATFTITVKKENGATNENAKIRYVIS